MLTTTLHCAIIAHKRREIMRNSIEDDIKEYMQENPVTCMAIVVAMFYLILSELMIVN